MLRIGHNRSAHRNFIIVCVFVVKVNFYIAETICHNIALFSNNYLYLKSGFYFVQMMFLVDKYFM